MIIVNEQGNLDIEYKYNDDISGDPTISLIPEVAVFTTSSGQCCAKVSEIEKSLFGFCFSNNVKITFSSPLPINSSIDTYPPSNVIFMGEFHPCSIENINGSITITYLTGENP